MFQPNQPNKIPQSRDEANERLLLIRAEIKLLENELKEEQRYNAATGEPLSPDDLRSWQIRARGALRHMLREQALCESYLKQYELEVEAEERAERRNAKQALGFDDLRDVLKRQKTIGDINLIVERVVHSLDKQHKERRDMHRAWLNSLLIEERVDEMDAENLLRHAYRILNRLAEQRRLDHDEEANILRHVISQRYSILQSIDIDTTIATFAAQRLEGSD